MYVFGFEQLLLSYIIWGCDSVFSMLKIVLGSIGSGVFKNTPCPVVVVFVYLAWLKHYATKLYLLYFMTHHSATDNNSVKADGFE